MPSAAVISAPIAYVTVVAVKKLVVGFLLLTTHGDREILLQLLIFNEEFLVSPSHQLELITSLLFVHTARRS